MRFNLRPLALAALLLAACDGGTEVTTHDVAVRVEYPATYRDANASGATVTLRSIETGAVTTGVTGTGGIAAFEDVIPGTYEVSAQRALTPDEALPLTGQRVALQLAASIPSRSLVAQPAEPLVLRLDGSPAGSLVIKEVFYTGSSTPSGGSYFSDQFVEIYNNSTDTLYADGLYIADLYGNSGQINPTSLPTPYQSDAANVYASNVWRIPGSGTQHPVAPGASILVAQDGANHRGDPNLNPASPVDLSGAEWETFNLRDDGRDIDFPGVPNLERTYFTGGFDWLLTVFGPAVVLFRVDDFATLAKTPIPGSTLDPRIRIPNAAVIDAFEALQNGASGSYKRVPPALDAGFVFAAGTYNSQSARRKVATTINGRRVLQDTNNSGADFEIVSAPTPRRF